MKWLHDALAEDLAEQIRSKSGRMVWTDMQLGPVGSPRPDVYSVPLSYSRFQPLAYECKVSVSDFRADITKGKWSDYLRFACAVIFAVPEGLITKSDIPPGCGLMVRGESGWRTVKGPTMHPLNNLPQDAWIKLLIDGMGRQAERMRIASANEWTLAETIRKKFGAEMAGLMQDRLMASDRFEKATKMLNEAAADAEKEYRETLAEARKNADAEAAQVDSIRSELALALGLDASASVWKIRNQAHIAAKRLNLEEEIDRMRRLIRSIDQVIEQAKEATPAIAKEPA